MLVNNKQMALANSLIRYYIRRLPELKFGIRVMPRIMAKREKLAKLANID